MNDKEIKTLEGRLNESISEMGVGFGPSLVNLLLYGPSGFDRDDGEKQIRLDIDPDNYDVLKRREESMTFDYNSIMHKFSGVVSALTGGEGSFPKGKRAMSAFSNLPYEDIRKYLRENVDEESLELLDEDTRREVMQDDSMNVTNRNVGYLVDPSNGEYLYALRNKLVSSCWGKYDTLWQKLSEEEKEMFPQFLLRVSEDPFAYWEGENYEKYREVFGDKVNDFMLRDVIALRITDTDIERAEETKEYIASKGDKVDLPGFENLTGLMKDHRGRACEGRPAGIHLALRDKSLVNFPMELQVMSGLDNIRDIAGPHKHCLYTQRGKKRNDTYG